jgi:hypothetical protein
MWKLRGKNTTDDEVFVSSWKVDGRPCAKYQLPRKPGAKAGKHESEPLGEFRGLLTIFRLLKTHGLGADMPTGGFVGSGGPNVIRMYSKTVTAICRNVA